MGKGLDGKTKTVFYCSCCGHRSPKWLGRCPSCNEWHSFAEETVLTAGTVGRHDLIFREPPRSIASLTVTGSLRISTGIGEMDRVLGGGLVGGSTVLVGGEPGIGKSTLLLQLLQTLAVRGMTVLYVSGEESAKQIKLRGERIGATAAGLLVLVEIALEEILSQIDKLRPAAVVVDSIQTLHSAALASAPGSVGQVRESAERLIIYAKQTGIPLFFVGHVTKDGSIAGPKVLEHMVDVVLYFEGDGGHAYRIVRSVKNRYGPAGEIGVFEMRDHGLVEVPNPSAYFLAERPHKAPGSVVAACMEGTRPILVEIQALVIPTRFGMPRRTAVGVDTNRVSLLVAVLDKVCGLHLNDHDIFVNVAGGVKLMEPAVDLGLTAALASGFLDRPARSDTVLFGEVGLAGEVRGVSRADLRLREAGRMGFKACICPRTKEPADEIGGGYNLRPIPVGDLRQLMEQLF